MREWIAEFISNNTSTLEEDFARLKPKDRFDVIAQLLPYVIPKQTFHTMDIVTRDQQLMAEGISNINKLFGIDSPEEETEYEEIG